MPRSPRSSSSVTALLVRGTEPVKGLPGFAANAFDAIYGEYRLEGSEKSVQVWATQEALYFDPLAWRSYAVGNYAARMRTAESGDLVLIAADLPISGWTAIAAFPARGLATTEIDRFLGIFLERFTHFLVGAKKPTDASFPATLEG